MCDIGQRLEDVYLSTETSTIPGGRIDPLHNVLKKEGQQRRQETGEEVRKGEWEAEELHRENKRKMGERDYTDEALALFNHHKLLLNL